MENKRALYLKLFTSTFYLSAFTIGGGYVIVPLMRKKFVEELGWIDEEEMLNLVAIAQSSPGPIAVNTSLLAGYRVGGVPGALLTILGTVLPPLIIITVISFFYEAFRDNQIVAAVLKGMQAGVAAVIADAVITMGKKVVAAKEAISIGIMVLAFLVAWFTNVNVALIILACGLFGALRTLYNTHKGRNQGQ